MSIEKETARLCTQILLEQFGDIPSRVGKVLLDQGRLPFLRIARSLLLVKPQRVAQALMILIQHNLVWHWEAVSANETFEINYEEILTRLRYGRYIALAEDLYGEAAVSIVSLLIDEGRVLGSDIVPRLVPYDQDLRARKLTESMLFTLVKEGYVKPTNSILQKPPQDRLLQYEEEAQASVRLRPSTKKGPLPAKDLLEVKEIARTRLDIETLRIETSGIKVKSKEASMTTKASKRQKVVAEDAIDDELHFRINPDKFNVHIRNEIVVASGAQRFNESAGRVLAGALAACLPNDRTPFSYRSEPLTYNTISRAIPATIITPSSSSHSEPKPEGHESNGLTNSHINGKDKDKETPNGSAKLTGLSLSKKLLSTIDKTDETALKLLYVKEYVNILCAADNPSESGRLSAFLSLTMGGAGAGGGKKVSVEHDIIARRMRASVLDNSVRDKWGTAGIRIIKILRVHGKLDGEQIAKRAMLKKVDVQKYLKDMSTEGLVSSIELARSADRAANRAIYLWFIDTPRTYASLLFSLYKTLSNILVRQQTERASVQPILDKRSRTDVQANEEQYLTRAERNALVEYEKKREMGNILIRRVDESCFVLREMARGGFIADDPFVPQEGVAA